MAPTTDMPKLNDLVGALKAASEPTRLRMLALLSEGELSVKDITDILGQSQPRVSRHLKLLADAGLAERHAEGAWAYYRLNSGGRANGFVQDLVSQLDTADPVIAHDHQRLVGIREAHAQAAADYFATVADGWDALRGLHVAESEIEAAIVEIAGRRKLGKVIDLGTGTGRMLELLADRYTQGVGIDSSREMISVARSKLAAAQAGHAQVRQADIAEPLEATEGADLVILHQVLHYLDDPGQVIANAARSLSADGAILIVDFAPHTHEFLRTDHAHRRLGLSRGQMDTWARASGLTVLETRDFANPEAPDGLTVCLYLLGRDAGVKGANHER